MSSESALGKADSSSTDSDKEFSCEFCGDKFTSQTTKRRHEKNFHAEQLPHECPDCGVAFHGRRGLVSHHTQKHDGRLAGYDKVCPECGDGFTTPKESMQYCSQKCGHKSQKKRVTLECETCGTDMETIPSVAEYKRFCSIDCKSVWFSDWISGKSHPNYKENSITKPCAWCGEVTDAPEYVVEKRDHGRIYCGRQCSSQWKSENWVGEDNPLYKGGSGYYGKNWHRKRREVIIRDQCRCQDCGATPTQLSREPSVHHITPIRDFDQPEDANTLRNLVTLCETCHSKWEGLYLRPDTRGQSND